MDSFRSRLARSGLQFIQKQYHRFQHCNSVKLRVEPKSCLIDDVINITASGLQPKHPVTMAAEIQEQQMRFISHAKFITDHQGALDISSAPSLGGSYQGVEPMGLMWSMAQASGDKPLRLMKKDITKPYNVKVSLLDGHVHPDSTKPQGVLQETCVERYYKHPDVERVLVRDGRIRGSFFKPRGEGPFPAIIDLFGSGGGLIEHRAALLASRGFATISLAYFGYDDLPGMFDTDIEYFEEAIDWLNNQPCVRTGDVGIIGISLGGELALLVASLVHKLKGVVAVSTNVYVTFVTHSYKGINHGFIEFKPDALARDSHNNIVLGPALNDKTEEARIKLENIQAPVLFIQGTADVNVFPSVSEDLGELRKNHGDKDMTLLLYKGAGHLIEPPYTPMCYASYHKLMSENFAWGGEVVPHAKAQEESWKATLEFFNKHLIKSIK